jgi:methylase of polypeptide subunit release factors
MDRDDILCALLQRLKAEGYRFVAVTPATHARVIARPLDHAPTLRDVFGWNRPFAESDVAPAQLALMREADIVEATPEGLRSTLRVASLGEDLFLHSAFPTDEQDAVFFGPDTYRFVRFAEAHVGRLKPRRIVDMGAGGGAGGIALSQYAPGARITLVDRNPAALALAAVNARAAGVEVEFLEGGECPPGADPIIANPPYMMDTAGRSYRDGGELLGGKVALEWAEDALRKLAPGGTMLLYTGAAFQAGEAPLLLALEKACGKAGASISVEELDPDVFGEELDHAAYAQVERIAAVGIVIGLPRD